MKTSKLDAIEIARAECLRRNWPWKEPIHVNWGFVSFTIRTNVDRRGGNACFRIRKRDGAIVSAGFADR
jgi:hypothetical protein